MNIVQFVDKPVSHVVHQEGMEDQEVVYYTEGLYENSVSDADGVQFVYSDDTEENIVSLEENDVEPQLKHFKLTDTQENMIIADEIYTENSERFVIMNAHKLPLTFAQSVKRNTF